MAHICGARPGTNRHDPKQTDKERGDYHNLILLCPTHHACIDEKANEDKFSIATLLNMKSEHEKKVHRIMETAKDQDVGQVTQEILILLEQNHMAWLSYGPTSDLARKNPHSDQAYAIWVTERLATIVPNNRKIRQLIEESQTKFKPSDQSTLAAFLIHAGSYEQWVEDEIDYGSVVKFPTEFLDRIREIADASA